MARRRFNKRSKDNKHKRRLNNKVAMQHCKRTYNLTQAKKHVINLSQRRLSDAEYLLLSKGLKFIPTPSNKMAKSDLMKDFNEMCRKMRCRYLYHNTNDTIHPFRLKTYHKPQLCCNTLENYIDQTKLELSSLQVRNFRDNLTSAERRSISSLYNDKSIIIKKSDKSNNVVITDKKNYLSEAYRQLDSPHYIKLQSFDFANLRYNLNNYIIGMHRRGALDKTTFDYLLKSNQQNYGPGHMHVLPKIHKLDPMVLNKITNNFDSIGIITPPGRPIISQIGTVTESIGRVVDSQLVSIVQSHSTYLKDTTDLILKLENLRPPSECLLCSFDISQMFTNCPIDEIMPAVKNAFDNFDKSQFKIKSLPTDDLIYLLESILRNNVFEFNNILWKQQIGAAIGAIPSPQVCNILMYQILNDILSKFKFRKQIFYIGRYMDDGIIIFDGTNSQLTELFEVANSHHKYFKFTHEISEKEIIFLDLKIYKGSRFQCNKILDTKIYFKPTNTFLYLHRGSCHNPHVFSGFIKGEVIRYIRNTNNDNDLQHALSQFKLNLMARGYQEAEIRQSVNEALQIDRKDLLNKSIRGNANDIPLVLTTKYNPCISRIKKAILKHWHLLNHDTDCREIFKNKPILAYKRHKNLADLLTSTKIRN